MKKLKTNLESAIERIQISDQKRLKKTFYGIAETLYKEFKSKLMDSETYDLIMCDAEKMMNKTKAIIEMFEAETEGNAYALINLLSEAGVHLSTIQSNPYYREFLKAVSALESKIEAFENRFDKYELYQTAA